MSNVGHRLLLSSQPCPYISGNCETLLHLIQPTQDGESHSQAHIAEFCDETWRDFGSYGFRRQGRSVYRPVCDDCHACEAIRVRVSDFRYSRRFTRTLRRNEDIEVVRSSEPLVTQKDAFRLYSKYIESRHADGAMYPPDINTMRNVLHLEPDRNDFHLYGFLNDEVVFIAQTDSLNSGLSANYTIFDSDLSSRSLGTFAILQQINVCRELNLPYLYLGYLLSSVKNMAYKQEFQPQERFTEGTWEPVDHPTSE